MSHGSGETAVVRTAVAPPITVRIRLTMFWSPHTLTCVRRDPVNGPGTRRRLDRRDAGVVNRSVDDAYTVAVAGPDATSSTRSAVGESAVKDTREP